MSVIPKNENYAPSCSEQAREECFIFSMLMVIIFVATIKLHSFPCSELSPGLPSSDIFQIDEFAFTQLKSSPPVVWFWKDDSQQWNPFRSEAIPSLERGKVCCLHCTC